MLMALVPARSASAQDSYALSAALASGPYVPIGRWLPVRVLTVNRSDHSVVGEVEFPMNGASEHVMFRLPITVPAKSRITTIAYVYVPALPEAQAASRGKNKPPAFADRPPICTAAWRDSAGAMLARSPILGQALPDENEGPSGRVQLDKPLMLSIIAISDFTAPQLPETASEPGTFATLFQSAQGWRLVNQPSDVVDAPRDGIGFDAVGLVLLDAAAVEPMDAAQQQALIQYISTGGTVVLTVGAEMVDPSKSWLAPYLPARYVGSRFAGSINVTTGEKSQAFPLVAPLDLAEWVADSTIAGAHVVMADKNYVHLAYRSVGLGRLIVTSFPLTSLDLKAPDVRQFWARALPSSPGMKWETSKLTQEQNVLLESMVGAKVPPWIVAAGLVVTYFVIVLLIQLLARQGHRPMGFAVAVAVAILMAVGLIVAGSFRDRSVSLSMARIDLLDLSTGGVQTEAVSLVGPNGTNFPIEVRPGTSLRQASTGEPKPLDLSISPLKVANAAVYAQRVEHVWQISSAVPSQLSLNASGMFDDRGLALSVDNQVGAIQKPVLVGPRGTLGLPDLAAGKSTLGTSDAIQSTVKLEDEQLRDRILKAAMDPAPTERLNTLTRQENVIYLAGWMADAPAALLELPADQQPAIVRVNALARTRVQILPSPVGSTVHIPSAFTQYVTGDSIGLPFDPTRQQWMEEFTPREFLLGVSVPQNIGHLRTTRVTISLQADAPQQTITLSRGQAAGGKVRPNPTGPEIVTWNQMIGSRSVAVDVADGDTDANGWIWIRVNIDGPPGQSRWKIHDLSVDYDGVIDGPPQPVVLPVREAFQPPVAPAGAPKPAQQKKPAKKPPAKPTTQTAQPKKKAIQPQ